VPKTRGLTTAGAVLGLLLLGQAWASYAQTPTGQLVVVLDTQPDGPQDFYFWGDWQSGSAFATLDDDADPTHPKTAALELPAGAYHVIQDVPIAYRSEVTCEDPTGDSYQPELGEAIYAIAAGETVVCTFHTTQLASITVREDIEPSLRESFSFAAAGWSFSLSDPGTPEEFVIYVLPGSYTVGQGARADIPLTSLQCIDPSGGTSVDLPGGRAEVGVSGQENVTCTFQNTLPQGFVPVAPCRLFDSRIDIGAPFSDGDSHVLFDWYRCGIPSTASALAVNVTAANPTASGAVEMLPAGINPLGLSLVSFQPGRARANNAVLSVNRDCCSFATLVVTMNDHSGTVDVIVDVSGYFQ